MAKDWNLVKAEFEDLYAKQRKPLKDVQRILLERHGFKASVRAFRMKCDQWGYRKNKKAGKGKTSMPSLPTSHQQPLDAPANLQSCSPTQPEQGASSSESSAEALESPLILSARKLVEQNQPERNSLHQAVRGKLAEGVRLLLSQGSSVNARDGFGCTPLHYAEDNDSESLAIVKLLLNAGADPLLQDENGNTPLHVWSDSVNLLKLVLPNCVNINMQNSAGETALHWAIRHSIKNGSPTAEAVMALINAGANVDIADQNRDTPFLMAVEPSYRTWYMHASDISIFVERTKCINGVDQPVTPFEVFLQNPDIDDLFRSESDLCVWAELVEVFIARGANSNASLCTGERLINAVFQRIKYLPPNKIIEHEYLHHLVQLLCTRVSLNASEHQGNELLHQLAWSARFDLEECAAIASETIDDLLSRKADPNAVNAVGFTPLAMLVLRAREKSSGILSVIRKLLDAGANPLQQDCFSDRLLYTAIRSLPKSAMREEIVECSLFSVSSGPLAREPLADFLAMSGRDPDALWWRRWKAACDQGHWRDGTTLLDDLSDLPLKIDEKQMFKKVACTVLADCCIHNLHRSYKRDMMGPYFLPKSEGTKHRIAYIIRQAQLCGIAPRLQWRDVLASVSLDDVDYLVTSLSWVDTAVLR